MSRKGNNAPAYKPKKRSADTAKSGPEIPPNFPQHDLPEPYAKLLTLGEKVEESVYASIAQELKQGDVSAAVTILLEMAQDQTYYDYVTLYKTKKPWLVKDARQWTRMHAIHVLGLLGEAAHRAIEPLMPLLAEDDEWVSEEMPFFYAHIGEAAIEPLARLLTRAGEDTFLRASAGESLAEIGEEHPELRDRVVAILDQALIAETEDPTLAAFIVGNLMDLGAKESLLLITQAYQDERVDETIVQMADVEEHFGLPQTTLRKVWSEDAEEYEDEADEEEYEEDEIDLDLFPPSSPRLPGASAETPPPTPYVAPAKVGRNEPCPCGSGKKYKKCCGA